MTIKGKCRFFIFLGIFTMTFLSFQFTDRAEAANPLVLKLSHQWSNTDLRQEWATWFAKMVEDQSKGEIKFEIYSGGVLYKPIAQFDALQKGALDLSLFYLPYAAGRVPETLIGGMPCLVRNNKGALKWKDGEIGKILDKVLKDNGVTILSWGWVNMGIGSKNKLLSRPEDLKGIKIRAASKTEDQLLAAAGASITTMPSTEVYYGLQTGALDGVETSYSSFNSFRLYEVIDYLVSGKNNYFSTGLCGILISNKVWDKLSQEQKNIMINAGRETETRYNDAQLDDEDKIIKTFSEKGVKIHNLTDSEFNEWEELAKVSAWKNFSENVKDGKRILEAALLSR
jgi:TRAP-type transport system periplasmic protein